jgi:CRP/FNR family cyclic AMP-dependent transcriptional regulator
MTDSPEMTIEALRTVPLFASLDDEDARALRGLLKVRTLPRGALLFRQGDEGDAMFLIEAGRVSIYITDEEGEDVTLAELARGDFFGEMALVEGKPRAANARATEDARLASLSREDFLGFVRRNTDVALAMVSAISERLRRTDELLRRRVSRNANVEDAARMTFADRLADRVTEFGGSWKFISVTIAFIILWMWVNSIIWRGQSPDPYPYSFLDVINGIVAALLTPIILISQNRQSEKDRLKSDLDFQINLKNELALAEVLRRLDVLESERLPTLFAEQNARLISNQPARSGESGSNREAEV